MKPNRNFNGIDFRRLCQTSFQPFHIYSILPIKLTATAHQGFNRWRVRGIYQSQEILVKGAIKCLLDDFLLPTEVTLTRIAPRSLDYDNLVTAFKHIRDVVADMLIPGMAPGRADGDSRLTFLYQQAKGEPKEYAVRIDIKNVEQLKKVG